jgi:hypothetical protein
MLIKSLQTLKNKQKKIQKRLTEYMQKCIIVRHMYMFLSCAKIITDNVRRCFENENDLSAKEKTEKKRTRLQKKNED